MRSPRGDAQRQQQLPALTRGEGVLECAFDHYSRSAADPDPPALRPQPLNRKQYLLRITKQV